MRRNQILAALCVIAAIAIAYFVGHAQAPEHHALAADATTGYAIDAKNPAATANKAKPAQTMRTLPSAAIKNAAPLPPPGTPLKQTFDELKARAESGDLSAASQLFHDLQRCEEARSAQNSIPALTEQLRNSARTDENDPLALLIEHQQKLVRARAGLCEGLSDAQIDWRIPAMLRAAQLGDVGASDCYVSPGGLTNSPEMTKHSEWVADFQTHALSLANSAIAKGDWVMVMQVANAYTGNDRAPMFGQPTGLLWQVTGQDEIMAYRYFKLAALGAPDDENGQEFKDSVKIRGQQLSPSDRAEAEQWAQDAFANYFKMNLSDDAYQQSPTCTTDENSTDTP